MGRRPKDIRYEARIVYYTTRAEQKRLQKEALLSGKRLGEYLRERDQRILSDELERGRPYLGGRDKEVA